MSRWECLLLFWNPSILEANSRADLVLVKLNMLCGLGLERDIVYVHEGVKGKTYLVPSFTLSVFE